MPILMAGPLRIPDAAKHTAADALTSLTEIGTAVPDIEAGRYPELGARTLREHLPPAVLDTVAQMRAARSPWLALSNLPETAAPPATPRDGFCDESLLRVTNLVHFGLLHLLGLTPVAFPWENRGLLVRNVAPQSGSARSRTSWGYARALGWHTDDSVLEHRPGFAPEASLPGHLSFYGVRNTEGVPTELLSVDSVLAVLPEQAAAELRRPQYAIEAPESYTSVEGGSPPRRSEVPVLWTLPDGNTAVRYGPDLVTGLTPWARAALDCFEDCLARMTGTAITVEAGGFLVFDNRRVMHRRAPFTPSAHGEPRWLRRCYAVGPATSAEPF